MYLFLMFGFPVAFILLVISEYPAEERPAAKKAFLRGMIAFIPTWVVARILGAIVPAAYGSFLFAFHEWADRLLPYSTVPALCYPIFFKAGERLPPGAGGRRLASFYAGALTLVGFCEALRVWGTPDPYALFVVPFILAGICVAMPKAAAFVYMSYGFELARTLAAIAAAELVVALCPFLFQLQLWPLALLLAAGAVFGAYRFAFEDLVQRPTLAIY